jgi:hypothetical protein
VVGAAGDEVDRRAAPAHLVDGGEGLGGERRVGDIRPVRQQKLMPSNGKSGRYSRVG